MGRTSIATDNYNRAGPNLGSNWLQLHNAGNTQIDSSVRIRGTTGFQSPYRWAGAGTFSNDQYSSLLVSQLNTAWTDDYGVGVIVRASADTLSDRDFYYAYLTATKKVFFGKVVNGTETQFASGTVSAFVVSDRIELEAIGSSISVFRTSVALGGSFTVTDSALASGAPGTTTLGNITVDVSGDDWDGGDATASAGPSGFGALLSNERNFLVR